MLRYSLTRISMIEVVSQYSDISQVSLRETRGIPGLRSTSLHRLYLFPSSGITETRRTIHLLVWKTYEGLTDGQFYSQKGASRRQGSPRVVFEVRKVRSVLFSAEYSELLEATAQWYPEDVQHLWTQTSVIYAEVGELAKPRHCQDVVRRGCGLAGRKSIEGAGQSQRVQSGCSCGWFRDCWQ